VEELNSIVMGAAWESMHSSSYSTNDVIIIFPLDGINMYFMQARTEKCKLDFYIYYRITQFL